MKKIIGIFVCTLLILTVLPVSGHTEILIGGNELSKNAEVVISPMQNDSWMKTYGGWREDAGVLIEQTTDSGYIIVGGTESYGAGKNDVWLIKTDSSGNKMWDKTFGGKYSDYGYSVQQTLDGGYIITGMKDYSTKDMTSDIWLIKTDNNGNEVWSKTFDSGGLETGNCVRQTSDGGYIVVGETLNPSSVCLIKTDNNGNKIWDKKFGEKIVVSGRSVVETPDHNYVVVGDVMTSQNPNNVDLYVLKTDSAGELLWEKTYGGTGADYGWSLVLTNDDNYIVVGSTKSYGASYFDVWLLKINSSGDLKLSKTIGGKYNERGYSVKMTHDGGYIIAGEIYRQFYRWHRSNGLLIKIDSHFNTEWMKTFGGFGNDGFSSVQQTTDGGYILIGYETSRLHPDLWLIKTDVNGNVKNKPFNFNLNLLGWLFERFPNAFPILRHLIEAQY